jgi:hypothetical protein
VTGRSDVAALVIEGTPDLGATLVRYGMDGSPAGDVWYGSADEAQLCAARDYGAGLGIWHFLPPDVRDVVAFAGSGARPERRARPAPPERVDAERHER